MRADILNLLTFIVASYVAIAIMFGVHAGLLTLAGTNWSTTSERSGRCSPLPSPHAVPPPPSPSTWKRRSRNSNVPAPIANLSATFGATIGQNGCAGIYPAMLAVMIAPTMGVDPLSLSFIAGLVAIVAVSSFGVAGVGGGATFAALIVLPAMGFPVTVAALLISIEPLIDMARTALNVNGAMTAGVLTDRMLSSSEDTAAAASAS